MRDPKDFLIPGFLPRRHIFLLAGPSATGKTHLGMEKILVPMTKGEPVFPIAHNGVEYGRPLSPLKVVYVSADKATESAQWTVEKFNSAYGTSIPLVVARNVPRPSNPDHEVAFEVLEYVNNRYPSTDLVFVEGFEFLMNEVEISKHSKVYKFLETIQRNLERKWRFSVLGTVHSPKVKAGQEYSSPRDMISGCTTWGDMTDCAFIYLKDDPKDSDCPRTLKIDTRWDAPNQTLKFQKDPFSGLLVPVVDPEEESLMKMLDQEFAKLLPLNRVFMKKELVELGEQCALSRRSVERWIASQIDSSHLESTGKGAYKRVVPS